MSTEAYRVFMPATAVEPRPVYFDPETVQNQHLDRLRDFVYIRSNIPGPGSSPHAWDEDIAGCECTTRPNEIACETDLCPCVRVFGRAYRNSKLIARTAEDGRSEDVDASCGEMAFQRPILECGSNCPCPKRDDDDDDCSSLQRCGNFVVGAGVSFTFIIFHDDRKGFGLKCLERIPAGSFVCEYAGQVIGEEEAKRRIEEKRRTRIIESESFRRSKNERLLASMNYIIVLSETIVDDEIGHHAFERPMKRGKRATSRRTIVDAERRSNVGHFINHSCLPNLVMMAVRTSRDVPRLALFARREIQPEEELTFHYGGNDAAGNTVAKMGDVRCSCQSENCAGTLPFDEALFCS